MKGFLKFLMLGLLGLALRMAFPNFKIDWLVLVLAYLFLLRRFFLSLSLIFLLGFIYSQFSYSPLWLWFLPYFLSLAVFHFFMKNFSVGPRLQLISILFLLLVFDGFAVEFYWALLGQGFFFDASEILWGLFTILMGVVFLPGLILALKKMTKPLFKTRPRVGALPWYEAGFKKPPSLGISRKPFGLEKGL